jgi:hypothetical protein
MPLAAWRIRQEAAPLRLGSGVIELEKMLEDWIADDPALIDPNLLVIQRQLHVEGGILDLLCVDLQGRATVVEIKRGKLIRETIAQAIDYAASIAAMSAQSLRSHVDDFFAESLPEHPGLSSLLDGDDEHVREVALVVVGVGAEPGLERMIDFLGSRSTMSLRAVTFEAFELGSGEKLLVREETEPEDSGAGTTGPGWTVSSVIERAGGPESGPGRRMLWLQHAAERNNLHVRPFKWALMFAPMTSRNRHLLTVWWWADKDELALAYTADALAEFYPITVDRVREILGPDGVQHPIRSDAEAEDWAKRLDRLFGEIAKYDATSEGD